MGALVTVMVSPQLADGCAVTDEAAAALVASGWTEQRWVTTEDELDTLPVGTVILSPTYAAEGMPVAFQKWADGLWHRGRRCGDTHPAYFLPALHLAGFQIEQQPERHAE